MSRRSTPERIYQASRAGTLTRLIGQGELPERAEALVAAWEARGPTTGSNATGAGGRRRGSGSRRYGARRRRRSSLG